MSTLVGKRAPLFEANAVLNGKDLVEKFSLEQFIGKKHVIFFFYPADFTFVCPTEIIAFQRRLKDFEDRNTVVVGCSVDSEYSHLAWLNTDKNNGGIKGVTFPLVSDSSMVIAQNFDVLAGEYSYNEEDEELEFDGIPVAYRALFLIDKQGVVRHQVINDLPLGRSVDEALRIVDALQFYEENGEVCPANWHKGDDGIIDNTEGIADYLSKH
ncbi:MAG: peroxiredoxin [Bacteroidales bacterium]|nr:peroxiredoxin [Bacteroidales bacterium]